MIVNWPGIGNVGIIIGETPRQAVSIPFRLVSNNDLDSDASRTYNMKIPERFHEINSYVNSEMNQKLIAPCGMNCAICSRYLAFNNDVKHAGIRIPYCAGCRQRDKKCAFLKKRCQLLLKGQVRYCYECQDFPCEKLLHIDKRYQTFFRMSMIDNLKYIKANGIKQFLDKEKTKWQCPECGDIICCHNGICFNCGTGKLKSKNKVFRWENE